MIKLHMINYDCRLTKEFKIFLEDQISELYLNYKKKLHPNWSFATFFQEKTRKELDSHNLENVDAE